jgi:hypothetical protein
MPTLHIVYPRDSNRRTSPWSIGNHLYDCVLPEYSRKTYAWDGSEIIVPETGDILLGHPHPDPSTTFRRSFDQVGWARRYVLCPFTTNPGQMYFVESYASRANHFFAICGPTWFEDLERSRYGELAGRMTRLDMAVDEIDHLTPRTHFNAPHRRRYVYIGSALPLKGTLLLEKFSSLHPKGTVTWLGGPSWAVSHMPKIAYLDLSNQSHRKRLLEFDFVLSLGKFDANPTVLLEGARDGLIPVCTKGSGYGFESKFVICDPRDIRGVERINTYLQSASNEELINRHFEALMTVRMMTWTRFTDSINNVIRSDLDTPSAIPPVQLPPKRVGHSFRELSSPYRRPRSSRPFKILEHLTYFLVGSVCRLFHQFKVWFSR